MMEVKENLLLKKISIFFLEEKNMALIVQSKDL